MVPSRGLVRSLNGWLGKPIASPDSDPQRFFGNLFALPNPDPILRDMGQSELVYSSICADPHVLGDMRSIRGNFRSYDYRVVIGDEGDSKSAAAMELCQRWMQRTRPNSMADWLEVMWQMASAFAFGYRVHEVVLQFTDGYYLPEQVWDRPNRRVLFNAWGEPMLVTRENPRGAVIEQPWQFVISRHMATLENPYGRAALSSCFWPWTFKTGGWRYFVKYCERHGLPWPVARYPVGTGEDEQKKIAAALEAMIESGYIVIPDGTEVELLVPTGGSASGILPQQNLIDLANKEMSKALTGQAMVAELHNVGARAASETASRRQESIDDSVRDIAAQSMGEIFRTITLLNFGDGIAPPTLAFFRRGEKAGKERAEAYQVVAALGARPSMSALLEELGIPAAKDEADAILPPAAPTAPAAPDAPGAPGAQPPEAAKRGGGAGLPGVFTMAGVPGLSFARDAGITDEEAITLAAEAADGAIEAGMIAPVARMIAQFEADGRTLAEFFDALQDLVGQMDDAALRQVVELSLQYSIAKGLATQAP